MHARTAGLVALLTLLAAVALFPLAIRAQPAPRVRHSSPPGVVNPAAPHPHGVESAEAGEGGEAKAESPFDAEHGTWLNGLTRMIFGAGPVEKNHHGHYTNVKNDFIVVAVLAMALLGWLLTTAARQAQLRPEGKPHSLANAAEAAIEAYRDFLVGVMGRDLAYKYTPLIFSFFVTILFFNWLGLVPGMVAPTANANVPIALALCAFSCVHFIAIKEVGFKSWFMHLVGEPVWMAPLMFPLHLIGELIKPVSLSLRLLCNVFGEEMVAAQLALLAVGAMVVLHVPIPFQLPMLLLGLFFGFVQALVFSTLLAIYIQILATSHDDHDKHNTHGHVEQVMVHGRPELVAHPSETSIA